MGCGDSSAKLSQSVLITGDDAIFANRRWPPHPQITGGLKPGDPFCNETFPKVRVKCQMQIVRLVRVK